MSPVTQADGHDCPGLVGELAPGVAAMVEDVVVGLEDAVGEPVLADVLPDVLDRVELGRFWWQRHEGDVAGEVELAREVPAGLVEQQDGMGARGDRLRDFREMQRHRFSVAERQDEAGCNAACWTDRTEDVGRARPLVVRRRGPGAAPRPSSGDLVLLPDPGLVLEPNLYRLARRILLRDRVQARGEVFLNASSASGFWA
jgi:hypothetical protein